MNPREAPELEMDDPYVIETLRRERDEIETGISWKIERNGMITVIRIGDEVIELEGTYEENKEKLRHGRIAAQLQLTLGLDRYEELMRELKTKMPREIIFEGRGIKAEAIASDGFIVHPANLAVRSGNELIVGELTYIHAHERIMEKGKLKERYTVRPIIIYARYRKDKIVERDVYWLGLCEEHIVIDGRPITFTISTIAGSTLTTIMPLDDVKSFLNGHTISIEELRVAYEELKKTLMHFICLDWDTRLYDVLATFALHTYFYDITGTCPILILIGPKGSGKTRTMLSVTYASRRGIAFTNPSEAAVFRGIDAFKPTLGIDEKAGMEVQKILRGAYKRGMKVARVEKSKKEHFFLALFEIFTPVVFASAEMIEDEYVKDRSIIIPMKKRDDPNPESRDPESSDFKNIRSKFYLARLCLAWKYHEALNRIVKMKHRGIIDLTARDFEVWKGLLATSILIGMNAFKNVLSYARDYVAEKRLDAYPNETVVLKALCEMASSLGNTSTLEFTPKGLLSHIRAILSPDYEAYDPHLAEKVLNREWNPRKIGHILRNLGIRCLGRKEDGYHYAITISELLDLCRYYAPGLLSEYYGRLNLSAELPPRDVQTFSKDKEVHENNLPETTSDDKTLIRRPSPEEAETEKVTFTEHLNILNISGEKQANKNLGDLVTEFIEDLRKFSNGIEEKAARLLASEYGIGEGVFNKLIEKGIIIRVGQKVMIK